MQIPDNIILRTDSYKVCHALQYPPNTTSVYSYFESRGGVFPATCFFGLQYLLKRHCVGKVLTPEKIEHAYRRLGRHFGNSNLFYRKGWEDMYARYGGALPVKIRAVPEGSIVGTRNVLMTIENTDPKFWWLPGHLETLLVQTWYPSTVATISYNFFKMVQKYRNLTGSLKEIEYALHDFGFRGVSSVESAGIGGLGNLIFFRGTDTLEALEVGDFFYGEDCAGISIPATEHSTMTSWQREREAAAYANLLKIYPDGMFACVIDSYDDANAVGNIWGGTLRDEVLHRDGRFVIRPDSGDPAPTSLKLIEIAGERFGTYVNDKGYRVLNDKVRMIWGDGIDLAGAESILKLLMENGWAAENISFGMGGGLLQKLNRDTSKYAFKCSQAVVDGVARDVFKQPAGQPEKASKKGRFKLIYENNEYRTVAESDPGEDMLQDVFLNGELVNEVTLADVRLRAGA